MFIAFYSPLLPPNTQLRAYSAEVFCISFHDYGSGTLGRKTLGRKTLGRRPNPNPNPNPNLNPNPNPNPNPKTLESYALESYALESGPQ